jgi:1,2-diacylglycerol 3-alpha-glucosyltransferase
MRIGMMVDMYKPYVSGITNYVALNKRVLESLGHRVFVFTFGSEDYEDDELRVIRSPGLPLNIKDTGFHVSFRYSRSAQRKVRTMDVLHVHHPFLSGPLALRYAKRHDIPVVYTNHTRYDLYAHHYLPAFIPDSVGQTFLQTYLPNFCQRCDLVIAPSPGIKRVMRQLGVTTSVKVIPNGVDVTPFATPPNDVTRAQAGLPREALVLMYLGRLSPEKKLPFLLRAFFGIAAARPDVVLALVGDGPDRENLHDLAQRSGFGGQVKFLGKVPYELVPTYLKLGDVFVSASDSEVHPLSLIEAMAAGLPAVGVDSPGVGDTIVDGENGLLSQPDLAAFTARLMQIVIEPDLRQRLAAGALASAKQYDVNLTAGMVLAEYERLVEQRRPDVRRWTGAGRRIRNILP